MEQLCPRCKEKSPWENNPYRPFCSKPCKENDLGNWATDKYRIPMHEVDEVVPAKPEKPHAGEE